MDPRAICDGVNLNLFIYTFGLFKKKNTILIFPTCYFDFRNELIKIHLCEENELLNLEDLDLEICILLIVSHVSFVIALMQFLDCKIKYYVYFQLTYEIHHYMAKLFYFVYSLLSLYLVHYKKILAPVISL